MEKKPLNEACKYYSAWYFEACGDVRVISYVFVYSMPTSTPMIVAVMRHIIGSAAATTRTSEQTVRTGPGDGEMESE